MINVPKAYFIQFQTRTFIRVRYGNNNIFEFFYASMTLCKLSVAHGVHVCSPKRFNYYCARVIVMGRRYGRDGGASR